MKTLWFMPIAFVAGVHGFAIFTPYLLLVLAASRLLKRRPRPAVQVTTGAVKNPAAV